MSFSHPRQRVAVNDQLPHSPISWRRWAVSHSEMSNTNGLDSIDRKNRIPSPSSSHGNVVDHDAPPGANPSLIWDIDGSTSVVTEEYAPSKRHVADGKTHMLIVQPLKRSEMQVGIVIIPAMLDLLTTFHQSRRMPRTWVLVRCARIGKFTPFLAHYPRFT